MSCHSEVPIYRNPIIDGDVPDPDVVRVDGDYYLVASSFNRAPGLRILTSRDLVNWHHVNHALTGLVPADWFSLPRHGAGVWAPSIRFHDGMFHIVYPDPDQGIFVVSASDPREPWSVPRLLLAGKGLIDPCPLWGADGRVFLVHGWARSRSGRSNVLTVLPMNAELTRAIGPALDVIDGDRIEGCTTLEGPKFYERDGWYWIFAPAGGVAEGWQYAFRSRDPMGPYHGRKVLSQGETLVNGPHQGAWVQTAEGDDWFLHFQDRGPFGRVLHLQPMSWDAEGWPRIGGATRGGPAWPESEHPSPHGAVQGSRTLTCSDDFRDGLPGPQWAWQANQPAASEGEEAAYSLTIEGVPDGGNLRSNPRVLGQPLPGMPTEAFVTVSVDGPIGVRAGMGILGRDYVWIGLERTEVGSRLKVAVRCDGDREERCLHMETVDVDTARVIMRAGRDARVAVAFEIPGRSVVDLPVDFEAAAGQWIGAEIVLFASAGRDQVGGGRFEAFTVRVDESGETGEALNASTSPRR